MWPKVRSSPRRNTGRLVALFNFKTKFTPGLFVYLIFNQLPSHNTLADQCHSGFSQTERSKSCERPTKHSVFASFAFIGVGAFS